ncbi:MAG: Uma2 family endonuclease [Planctomycetota bacterium]
MSRSEGGDMMLRTEFISTASFTQDEFESWVREGVPSDIYRYELVKGRVVMEPPAGYPHGELDATLSRLIGNIVADSRLGKVFGSSMGFALPTGDTLSPDVAFVSNQRLADGPAPEEGRFLRTVPDLVVEILSPSTQDRDRTEKRSIYRRSGVREYWIVDPRSREVTIIVHGARGEVEKTFTGEDALSSEVLPQMRLPASSIFG